MLYHTLQEAYYVYILLCSDGSYYTGLTDDLVRHFKEHAEGFYETCYTYKRRPVELKYYETIPFLDNAVSREHQLKGWSRSKKAALIEGNFHKLQLLSQCMNMSHNKYADIDKESSSLTEILDSARTAASALSTPPPSTPLRVGILGGGQLGRMLLQAAANYPVITHLMENDAKCPAAHLCHHFKKGDITNYEDVYQFGKGLDALTIEIESVNDDALLQLEKEGVKIYPRPSALRIIKNKILQNQFYLDHEIPSPEFVVTQNRAGLAEHKDFLPAVHKIGMGGYDGRGVEILHTEADFPKAFDAPGVLEKMINIRKEISIIIAANDKGETAMYPAVDMVFDNKLNLLDYQISPADLPEKVLWKAQAIARKVVKDLESPGIFAVELFIDDKDQVFANETAPRVHNSGHHTIEANFSSQFDMLWRIMLGYPLGNTAAILPAAIVNLLGAEGHSGPAVYEGLNEILKLDNVFVHLYGKYETRQGRKMGHVTILSSEKQELIHQANRIKHNLRVIAVSN